MDVPKVEHFHLRGNIMVDDVGNIQCQWSVKVHFQVAQFLECKKDEFIKFSSLGFIVERQLNQST
jgi:hypothetical protein